MIEAKYKFKGEDKYNYRDFNSEKELTDFLEKDSREVEDYQFREKKVSNWFLTWWNNMRNTKKNWKKVQGSPFASLNLALKFRKLIVGLLIPYLAWMTFKMVKNYNATGFMGTVGKVISIAIMSYICWKIYSTIPQAKKQIEYYKKYPHTINYVPTNTKETVDDILNKIKDNSLKGGSNVRKEESNKGSSSS